MTNPYSGEPPGIVVNGRIVKITVSDCVRDTTPEFLRSGESVLMKVDSEHLRYWKEVIATCLLHDAKFWPLLDPHMIFILDELPTGYELYMKQRPETKRLDCYLRGFKGDKILTFTSPADFVLHAKWLVYGCPAGACECAHCSTLSQTEIRKRLKDAKSLLLKAERVKALAAIARLQTKVTKLDEDIARYDEETDIADSIESAEDDELDEIHSEAIEVDETQE